MIQTPVQLSLLSQSQRLLDELPGLSPERLEALVRYHNRAYFVANKPEISDEAFDKLVETLRRVRPQSEALVQIGADNEVIDSQRARVHAQPMLSLDKCYDDDTLTKWKEKINGPVVVMPKIDGVACAIHYDRHGALALGLTRGDGRVGEDITQNVACIADVPKKVIPLVFGEGDTIEVRGEVYLRLSRFQEQYAEQFANPRNLAAGALKQKDAARSQAYGLSFFPYDIRGANSKTEREKFQLLKQLGFNVPTCEWIESDLDLLPTVKSFMQQRDSLDYEIDGVVLRADALDEQRRLGETAHHPRYAIAYKFQGDSAQTELLQVEWSVGRTGAITPVAVVKPVFISGATVSRASLHNVGQMTKLGAGIGSLVEVVRRGGVIPHVERVIRSSNKPIEISSICPSCRCSANLDGDFLRCSHPETCPAIQIARVIHFCAVADLKGFGEQLVTALFERQIVSRVSDLFRIRPDQLLAMPRMGTTLATKLINEVNSKRLMSLSTFLTALGFDEIGPTVAEKLSAYFGSLDAIQAADEESLMAIDGIGESIAESLKRGLKHYHKDIDDLRAEVQIVANSAVADSGHPLFGKNVVFTGTLLQLDRKEAQKQVRAVGGKTPSAVSASTDFLVAGGDELEAAKVSTKLRAARKLIADNCPIQIISEADFLKLL